MRISTESYGHAVVLILEGELSADSLGALKQAVDHQLEGKEVVDVVLNLENVPFADSAALEYLLDLQDKLAERLGQIKLLRPEENIRKILELTRLEPQFEMLTDATEAVRVMQG